MTEPNATFVFVDFLHRFWGEGEGEGDAYFAAFAAGFEVGLRLMRCQPEYMAAFSRAIDAEMQALGHPRSQDDYRAMASWLMDHWPASEVTA